MPTDAQLEAFFDETLSPDEMAALEESLRRDRALRQRVGQIIGRRDGGVHSLGALWRRERLSCPDRDELGAFVMHALAEPLSEYIQFHLDAIGCRYCQANVEDLREARSAAAEASDARRRRYLESSVGRLPRHGD